MTVALCAALLCSTAAGTASASGRGEVDESRLVPALAPGWGDWRCQQKRTGPVCKGERHQRTGWEAVEQLCGVPLMYTRYSSDRYQTRYYDADYLNYFRKFRTDDSDELSPSPEGPATVVIRSHSRFFETFDVPGDGGTMTITTIGTLWEVRRVHGGPVLKVIGIAVEPYNGPATFSGRIITADGTQTYQNVSLDVPQERFFAAVCEAVGNAPASATSATSGHLR